MNTTSRNMNSVGALVLIGLGVLFLFGQFFGGIWSLFGTMWPLFIVLFGAAFLVIAVFGDRKLTGFVFPGAVITATGLILWAQWITGRFETWAYAWTLYPIVVGLALQFHGKRDGHPNEISTGRGMMFWGGIAFLGFAALFELAIFGGMSGVMQWIVPVLLIGGGVLLLGRGLPMFREAGKPKRSPSYSDNSLQRQIDAALAEDAPIHMGNGVYETDDVPEKPKV